MADRSDAQRPSDGERPADGGPGEPVGSLGQETFKLLRALADDRAGQRRPGEESAPHEGPHDGSHQCTTGWCPVCRVVGFVKENPDVVDEVGAAALHLARTVRDAVDVALRQAAEARDTTRERHDR